MQHKHTNEVIQMVKKGNEGKNKPELKLRVGNTSATVWKNKKDDNTWHTVNFQRSYKDKNDEWQNTDSFNTTDLWKVKVMCDELLRRLGLKEVKQEKEEEE